MRWLLTLALLLTPFVLLPVTAQPNGTKAATTAPAAEKDLELAEARTRAEELAQRNAILEAKAELSDEAYSRLENLIGAFGAVITVVVLFFALRTKSEAIAEARNAAAEVAKADAKTAIDAAQSQFAALLAQERSNVAEIEAKLAEARQFVAAISGLQADALKGKEAIEADANRLAQLTVRLAQEAKGGSKPDLSEDDRKVLEKASEAAKDTAQNQWTADQFRAAISKARFVDEDWPRVAELAEDMARVHGENDEDFADAMNELGDAALERYAYDESIAAYQQVIDRLKQDDCAELRSTLDWALHCAGYAQNEVGHPQLAEPLLVKAADLACELYGPEALSTLITRHVLACAILDQDRAAEAEAELRLILPLREKVDGPEANGTQVTRYVLALAVLENGDPVGAKGVLEAIPDLYGRPDWKPRHAARLAYVRGKVADALSQRKDAAAHLAEARRIYSEHLPEDYVYRRQLEDYITKRGGL